MEFTTAMGNEGGSDDVRTMYYGDSNTRFLDEGSGVQLDNDSSNLTKELNMQINGVSIHRLFSTFWFIILMVFAVIFFSLIMLAVCLNRDKPHIQNRSPYLILMITGGVYADTIFKLFIVWLPFQAIDLKCQMAIITRVVFHYIAYLFILFRITRV